MTEGSAQRPDKMKQARATIAVALDACCAPDLWCAGRGCTTRPYRVLSKVKGVTYGAGERRTQKRDVTIDDGSERQSLSAYADHKAFV